MNAWAWLGQMAVPWFFVALICVVMLVVLALLVSLIVYVIRGMRSTPRPDKVTKIMGK